MYLLLIKYNLERNNVCCLLIKPLKTTEMGCSPFLQLYTLMNDRHGYINITDSYIIVTVNRNIVMAYAFSLYPH